MSTAVPAVRSLQRWTAGTVIATALARAVTSVLTYFAVGPLIGSITLELWTPDGFAIGTTVVEYLAAAIAVAAGLVIAARVSSGGHRALGHAGVTGWIVLADTTIYLGSITVGAGIYLGTSFYLGTPYLLVLGANLALSAAATVTIRRSRPAMTEYTILAGPYRPKPSWNW
jgi:hypothetical protein